MSAFYNENNPYTAAWLRELIKAGLIANGIVDERSIVDIKPDDLDGFNQIHFFAGIGGWSYALRLAGIGDETPIWTGSCPCQSISRAGLRKGHADERHLWPAFQHLISECRPAICFGEQVAGPDGREWFAGVRADLEAIGYACGAADLCAAGVGAPHIRQRLYWVAYANRAGWNQRIKKTQRMGQGNSTKSNDYQTFWDNFETSKGDDGKFRRIGTGILPLVNGVSKRMERLRGAGNAIVPPLAAEFIKASIGFE